MSYILELINHTLIRCFIQLLAAYCSFLHSNFGMQGSSTSYLHAPHNHLVYKLLADNKSILIHQLINSYRYIVRSSSDKRIKRFKIDFSSFPVLELLPVCLICGKKNSSNQHLGTSLYILSSHKLIFNIT